MPKTTQCRGQNQMQPIPHLQGHVSGKSQPHVSRRCGVFSPIEKAHTADISRHMVSHKLRLSVST